MYTYTNTIHCLGKNSGNQASRNRGHDLIPLYQHFITIQTPLSLYIHKIHSYNGSAVFPFKREQFVSVYICVQELKNIFRCCLATFLSISDARLEDQKCVSQESFFLHHRCSNNSTRGNALWLVYAVTTATCPNSQKRCVTTKHSKDSTVPHML